MEILLTYPHPNMFFNCILLIEAMASDAPSNCAKIHYCNMNYLFFKKFLVCPSKSEHEEIYIDRTREEIKKYTLLHFPTSRRGLKYKATMAFF